MKIKEFVNRYNALETIEAKNNFIQNNLTVKEYLPFINKITLAENLIDKSVYEHENYIDNDGNTQSRKTGNIKLDSVVQYLLFNRIIIEYYTNLEIETKGFYEEYDMLCQNGIMEQIASLIPKEEINELKTIIDFKRSDAVANAYETHSFISNQISRFGNLIGVTLKPFAEKIANEIENMDESKIEKLGKSLEKVFKRVR